MPFEIITEPFQWFTLDLKNDMPVFITAVIQQRCRLTIIKLFTALYNNLVCLKVA